MGTETLQLDYRSVAWLALLQIEPDAITRQTVWDAAEAEERKWAFLVREHGYPAGWFVFGYVDDFLRKHRRKGIALEIVPVEERIAAWWLVDAPDEQNNSKVKQDA